MGIKRTDLNTAIEDYWRAEIPASESMCSKHILDQLHRHLMILTHIYKPVVLFGGA